MLERQTEFLIGVRFRVVLVDPAREAGADEFGVLGDDFPVGVLFYLRIDEGHLLRTGDALVSIKHSSCWLSQPEETGLSGRGACHDKLSSGWTDRNLLYTFVAVDTLLLPPSCRQVARVIASSIAWLAPLPDDGRNECALSPTWTIRPAGEVQSSQRLRHMSFQ